MDKPTWKPHGGEIYDALEVALKGNAGGSKNEDHSCAADAIATLAADRDSWRKKAESFEERMGRAAAVASGSLRSISEQAARIAGLEAQLDRVKDRARIAAQTLIAKIGAPGPENVDETAARAADRIVELEAMLGAGNLCEYQIILKEDSAERLMLATPQYGDFSIVAGDNEPKDLENCLPVLIDHHSGGLSVWRFYRKAGH